VAHTPWWLVAAPSYLDASAAIEAPADLARHPALVYGNPRWSPVWMLGDATGGEARVAVKARLVSDNMVELRKASQAGLGVTALPSYLSQRAIDDGSLRRVLPAWNAGDGMITLLVPAARGALPAVRAFAEFLIANFASAA
jgi:DNA-binding transcriptional LysR family regulator